VNQRHVMVAIFFLGIAACTTSGPESTVSGDGGDGAIEQVGLSDAAKQTIVVDGEEMVCTKERLTGSRIPTKVCLTRAERARLQEIAQSSMEIDKMKPGSNQVD